MELIVVSTQSFSDIVTNSSSELFVADTYLNEKQIFNILDEITTGFEYPIRFSIEDYRKELYKREHELEHDESKWRYGSYYESVRDFFTDLEDENSIVEYRLSRIDYPLYEYNRAENIFITKYFDFLETLGVKMEGRRNYWYPDIVHSIPDGFKKFGEFFSEYEKSGNPLPTWWSPKEEETIQYLNGKILIVSSYDNSIPYDTFDIITEITNGFHIHLG